MNETINEGQQLYGLLQGDINKVLMNGEEIRSTIFRSAGITAASILSRNDESAKRTRQMVNAILLTVSCILIDMGLYSAETEKQIYDILNRCDIVAEDAHRVNTGDKEIDDYVNMPFDMGFMEESET